MIVRLIREWKADVVLSHRPNDYHPDHRYTGVLVQDAAYMVTVPFFCPDIPAMKKNPAFFYCQDRFEKPAPFKPDVLISVDSVMEKKLDALGTMISQFAEGGANGHVDLLPTDAEGQKRRHQEVRDGFARRQKSITERYRGRLTEWYPPATADKIQHIEAFEICEYGGQPDKSELKRLFPIAD